MPYQLFKTYLKSIGLFLLLFPEYPIPRVEQVKANKSDSWDCKGNLQGIL